MAIVNAYILYCESRNENQRNNCYITFFLQKVGEGFAEKSATLAQNDISQAASNNRLLRRHFAYIIPTTGKKAHPTRVCKICSEKFKNSTGKRERKRLCGGVLIVMCHSACQSASNCTTQSQTICKYRKCVLCRFFLCKFSMFYQLIFYMLLQE